MLLVTPQMVMTHCLKELTGTLHATIFQTRSGLGPHITGSDESVNTTTKAATRFTKNEACYSRSGDKSCIMLYA